jgi:hypothetical protein
VSVGESKGRPLNKLEDWNHGTMEWWGKSNEECSFNANTPVPTFQYSIFPMVSEANQLLIGGHFWQI